MDWKSSDRERPDRFCPHHEVWQALATAIIRYAIDDYKHYLTNGRRSIEHFFKSDYFEMISDLNPDYLIANLQKIPEPDRYTRRRRKLP